MYRGRKKYSVSWIREMEVCLTNKKLVSKRPQPKQTFSTSGAMTSSKEDTNCLADPSGYFQNCPHAWDKYFHNTRGEKNKEINSKKF